MGRRLLPLTGELPKPLLPVLGRSILEHTLDQLVDLGVSGVAINLHHSGRQIEQRIGDTYKGLQVYYSPEPELLGTGGALVPLRELLVPADAVLLLNGDSLCRWPLAAVVGRHLKARPAATLLLARRADPDRFGGGVGMGKGGRIVSFRPGEEYGQVLKRRVFAGLHVLDPGLLRRLPSGPSDIVRDLYEPLLARGETILGVETRRPWFDLGTPARYLEGILFLARRRGLKRLVPGGSWTAPGAEVARGARLANAVVEAGAAVAAGARVERSVVLPGARVPAGAVLRSAVVGPGAHLPAGVRITGHLVTRQLSGAPIPEGASRLAGLVYTPIADG